MRSMNWRIDGGRETDSSSNETGSASIEFITVGMLLLIPVTYFVIAMASIQGAALAVEGGARHAARSYVRAPSEADAERHARFAITAALEDFGLADTVVDIRARCSPQPRECLVRRGLVTIDVAATVPLPLVPPEWFGANAAGVTVTGTATQQVSRFWSPES